jgi:prepilin-type N-terminal cleavage/methylation domain-containing protein
MNMNTPAHAFAGRLPSRGRRGFTFAEVMFAVVILGIGFIMIAAIFPVAIQQNQQTSSDAISTAVVQQAVATLQQPGLGTILSYNTIPSTKVGVFYSPFGEWTAAKNNFGNIDAFTTPPNQKNYYPWQALGGKLISASDPRYGWTFAYRYTTNQTIEALIFVAQAPAQRGTFRTKNGTNGVTDNTDDLVVPPSSGSPSGQSPATFMLKRLQAKVVTYGGTQPDRLYFATTVSPAQGKQVSCLGEGAYVLVADGDVNNTGYSMPGTANPYAAGVVFRLGAQVSDSTTSSTLIAYELVPGQDLMSIGKPGTNDAAKPPYTNNTTSPTSGPSSGAIDVLVLGKAMAYPGTTDIGFLYNGVTNDFAGQPMDLTVYRTTIGLK